MKKLFFVFLILTCSLQSPAWAGFSENVTSDRYIVRAPSRLVQGIVNVAFCWIPLFSEPIKAAQSSDMSMTEGIFRGIGYPVPYLFLGGWDILTFWMPGEAGEEAGGAAKYNVFNHP